MAMGHPFDEQAKRRYLLQIERGVAPRTAAARMQFTWGTIVKALKTDSDFKDAYDHAQAMLDEQVETVLLDTALDGNLGAIKMWLHNRKPLAWRDDRQVTHTLSGPGGGPIQIAQGGALALRAVLTDPALRSDAISMLQAVPAAELESGEDEPEILDTTGTENDADG